MKKTIFFVNSMEEACGIHQFGYRVYNNIINSTKYNFLYFKVPDVEFLENKIEIFKPSAIIYNFYPVTMPWLTHEFLNKYRNIFPHIAQQFEVPITEFDYYITYDLFFENPDPNRKVFKTGRSLVKFSGTYPKNDRINIGSFGFAFGWKSFPELVKLVNWQFDDVIINLQIPFASFGDKDGKIAREVADNCRSLITKPDITLNITHEFLDQDGILQFLANNDLNAFIARSDWKSFQNIRTTLTNFISTVPDLALSVKRPMAISEINVLRDIVLVDNSICVEHNSLYKILEMGTKPLEKFYRIYSQENLIKDYENLLDEILWK